MTLVIELSPELERRLEEVAARNGKCAAEYARSVLQVQLSSTRAAEKSDTQMERNRRAIALLHRWSEEDAVDPDPDPVPVIPPLSLRQIKID